VKILLGVHHFPPRHRGGVELRALRLAKALQARGHLIQVVCIEEIDRGGAGELDWVDGAVEGVPVRRLTFNRVLLPSRSEYDNPLVGAHVDQMLAAWRPDLLHVLSGYLLTASPLVAARARDIPSVLSLTDMWFLCPRITMLRSDGTLSAPPVEAARCVRCLAEERRRYRVPGRLAPGLMAWYWRRRTNRVREVEERQAFLRDSLGRVDAVISRSACLRSVFERAGAVEPGRILLIAPSRDARPAPPPEKARPLSDCLRVGFMGQIAPHKGVHVAVEAMKLLNGVRVSLDIRGDWQAFPRYAGNVRSAAAGNPRIQCLPPFEGEAALALAYDAIDVLVVPSLSYENAPNVILEAFLRRTPVVASNTECLAEIVREGRGGLLFEPGDARGLAAALRRLVDEPGLLARLGRSVPPVRPEAEEVADLEAVYRRVVAR
jgi:glycosyltransferase involved in cell wall biosynthesis